MLALILAAIAVPWPAAAARSPPADAQPPPPAAGMPSPSPQLAANATDATAIIRSNLEMHAALTNENITHIYLANNITSEAP